MPWPRELLGLNVADRAGLERQHVLQVRSDSFISAMVSLLRRGTSIRLLLPEKQRILLAMCSRHSLQLCRERDQDLFDYDDIKVVRIGSANNQ